MAIKNWINKNYLGRNKIKQLKNQFSKNRPFPYLELANFFREDKLIGIFRVLANEKFLEKESDLFKLKQTDDFLNADSIILKNFRSFLCSREFIAYMQTITGLKLKTNTIDINGSIYENTDFLLCHDDRLEGRKIAFMLYLSNFSKNDGGGLNLFASKSKTPTKIAKKIIPTFNTFAFFEVSNVSFHEVEEIVADKQRITINGWFHG